MLCVKAGRADADFDCVAICWTWGFMAALSCGRGVAYSGTRAWPAARNVASVVSLQKKKGRSTADDGVLTWHADVCGVRPALSIPGDMLNSLSQTTFLHCVCILLLP